MSYRDKYANDIETAFCDLENRIMADIIKKIKKAGKITGSADHQINRLVELGYSPEEIRAMIKTALRASEKRMNKLFDDAVKNEYTINKDIYAKVGAEFIPYEENEYLQQQVSSMRKQTDDALINLTKTLGVAKTINGQMTFLPLTEYYQKTLDAAVMDISSGAFDYNTVLKRTVRELANSGIRVIDYDSGYTSRVPVAARRAVMTGVSQLAGQISEANAEKLGTEHFEVSYHGGARPDHREWQGKVYTKKQLVTVCGLGTVTGLKGANCYHDYYPFIPGISERLYTDEWLEEQNRLEDIPKKYNGKDYTAYEAKQKQRQMETSMRAQRQKITLLKEGLGDENEIIIERARYRGQLAEYAEFCEKMGDRTHMDRVYIDGLGRV